jgi:hypothetical protein
MFRFGTTLQENGFLELREEGDGYLLCVGDCFDDGEDGVCMPLFCFSKRMSTDDVKGLIDYLSKKL